jgi:hypothetical protein
MAKSDLLKEAIADAKAVKETALANAKIALEEAFAPRINAMLSAKLAEEEMEDEMTTSMSEQEMDMEMEDDMGGEVDAMAMGDDEMDAPDSVGVGIDLDSDGSYDIEGSLGAEDDMGMDAEAELDGMGDEMEEPAEDLELESIIRELEEDLNEEDEAMVDAEAEDDLTTEMDDRMLEPEDPMMDEEYDIDEIIESILSEEEDEEVAKEGRGMMRDEDEDPTDSHSKAELEEAYNTIISLRGTINEVNLLNAKLLYTNKLFRNFELDENQKMKVIENFDRAGNTREVKLVFSTLAESFHVPVKKRKKVVKEGIASRTTGTTAPSTKTKQIINEGNELANRWKKLAGLLD